MNKLGYLRIILHKYQTEEHKLAFEILDHDFFEAGFITAPGKDFAGMVWDEVDCTKSISPGDLLTLLPDNAQDGVYEVYGEFWYNSWKNPDTPYGYGEWETAWELRESSSRQLTEEEAASFRLDEEEVENEYEYRTTSGPRKSWDQEPDLSKEGWEDIGFERFDYHEERYWRRKK